MIKLVIFDLDGVLVEAKNIHYDALNEALGEQYAITWAEHLSTYDGLKTNQKLEMLTGWVSATRLFDPQCVSRCTQQVVVQAA